MQTKAIRTSPTPYPHHRDRENPAFGPLVACKHGVSHIFFWHFNGSSFGPYFFPKARSFYYLVLFFLAECVEAGFSRVFPSPVDVGILYSAANSLRLLFFSLPFLSRLLCFSCPFSRLECFYEALVSHRMTSLQFMSSPRWKKRLILWLRRRICGK